ncbi:MAG TPA: hypothetical protein VL093_14150 [Flavipsychrobacter sp.]|nr:hypothetical protein [Flavipsychrobacter sp.]
MKKLIVLSALILGLCTSFDGNAQVRVNVNIGTPVVHERWYSNDNDYYYLPEPGVYYNVRRRVYVYPEGGRWVYASHLPRRYGNYTYRTTRVVRIHERSPFERDHDYRGRYRHAGKNHYERHDNGRHNGWDKHRGNDHRGHRH